MGAFPTAKVPVTSQLKVEQGVVPITPSVSSHAFTVTCQCLDGEKYSGIHRRQFALTGAYAFTDIKAQAQDDPTANC